MPYLIKPGPLIKTETLRTTSYSIQIPLLNDDASVDGVRAVLALLTYLDLSDSTLGDDGNHGLVLVHEWLRRSMAYSGHKNEHLPCLPTNN